MAKLKRTSNTGTTFTIASLPEINSSHLFLDQLFHVPIFHGQYKSWMRGMACDVDRNGADLTKSQKKQVIIVDYIQASNEIIVKPNPHAMLGRFDG